MTHIEQRGDLASQWTLENPILHRNEIGWEEDTRRMKLGDGVRAWNDLPYANSNPAPVRSVAGRQGDVTLTPEDVGLTNVDDTSDTQKPVSDAQRQALDLKAPLSSPTFTGDPKAPTPATADNDKSIATTEFVKAQGYTTKAGATDLLRPSEALAVAPVSPFTGTLYIARSGFIVTMSGGPIRPNWSSLDWVPFATLPERYWPRVRELSSPSVIFNASTTTYQFYVDPDGTVAIRVSSPTGNTLAVPLVWITDKPIPA